MDTTSTKLLMELKMPRTEKQINKIKNGAIYQAKSMGWIGDEYPYLDDKEENANIQDSVNSDDKEKFSTSSEVNSSYNNENETNNTIIITADSIKNADENKLIQLLNSKGLKTKVTRNTEEVIYLDERANKTVSHINQYMDEAYTFEKGSTVEIITTEYKAVPWNVNIELPISYASFDYNNDKCYVFNTGTKKGRYIAFLDNPSEIASGTAYDDFRQTRGLKYYINNKYIGDSTEAHLNYTFNGIDNVTLKIVAPYVFDFDEYKVVGTNVTLYEKNYSVLNLYNDRDGLDSNSYVEIALPSCLN